MHPENPAERACAGRVHLSPTRQADSREPPSETQNGRQAGREQSRDPERKCVPRKKS